MLNKYLMDNIPLFKEAIMNSDASFMEKISIAFVNKTHLFNKIKIHSNSSNMPKFKYEDYFVLLMSVYHQYPEVRHMFHEMQHDLNNFYHELIQEAIEKKEIRQDIDIKELTIFIQSCLKGHVTLWLNQSDFSLEEILEANIRMISEIVEAPKITEYKHSPSINSIELE